MSKQFSIFALLLEYLLYYWNMSAINEVKMLAAKKGITLTRVAEYMSAHSDKEYTLDKLSKKLRGNTIRYEEMKLIANALNMELMFIEK